MKVGPIAQFDLLALRRTYHHLLTIVVQPLAESGTKPVKELPGTFLVLNGIGQGFPIIGSDLWLQEVLGKMRKHVLCNILDRFFLPGLAMRAVIHQDGGAIASNHDVTGMTAVSGSLDFRNDADELHAI